MLTVIFFGVLGAIVGSFCNVLIYRIPRIINGEALTLSFPASHCPSCKKPVKIYYNIPILGWLLLRGRCSGCDQPISARYPLVELMMALLFALVIFKSGVTAQSVVDLVIISLLVPLFFIDLETALLPDRLTYPLILIALGFALSAHARVGIVEAVAAAIVGFGVPWLLDRFYYWRHGKTGMGMGDMKLFAGLGAWMGLDALFSIMIISSILAITSAVFLLGRKKGEAFPFGPYMVLAAVGWNLYVIS